MAKLMSKSELIQKLAERHPNNMTRQDVKGVIESLAEIGYKELKKSGAFFVPGFAKFVVIKKPATKERSGINPLTKEPTIFKAKPARKIIRARPVTERARQFLQRYASATGNGKLRYIFN
jgi:DNA-binding protein HU-beta